MFRTGGRDIINVLKYQILLDICIQLLFLGCSIQSSDIHGSCFQGSKDLVPKVLLLKVLIPTQGYCFKVLVSSLLFEDPCFKILVSRSLFQDPCFKILVSRSLFSRIVESRFLDPIQDSRFFVSMFLICKALIIEFLTDITVHVIGGFSAQSCNDLFDLRTLVFEVMRYSRFSDTRFRHSGFSYSRLSPFPRIVICLNTKVKEECFLHFLVNKF